MRGNSYAAKDVIGVYPLFSDGTCRFLVFDFDNHEKNAEKRDFANTDDTWIEEVEAMRDICTLNGIEPLVERSRSGKGAHIWIFFDKQISAALVRKFGFALLDKGAEQVNLKSFNYYDRMLPAQDPLENVAIGNLIALPLQGRALKDGNSAFVDSNWNAYPDQWNALLSKPKLSEEFLENKIREWIFTADDLEASSDEENREKPWDRMKNFAKSDVDGKMDITLSNGIYVDSTNLKPAMQNKIRRMAAFSNPVFYKNRAIGTSNYDTSRWIYLGKDHLGGYIQIPRGLQDELIANIDKAGIKYSITDERQQGRNINVEFNGELRLEQDKALKELIKYDNGILHAATAFGKTVVCSAVIAEKKLNTLILLESSALIEQWKDALNQFLIIDEELPRYKTKTGRLRTRKRLKAYKQIGYEIAGGLQINKQTANAIYDGDNYTENYHKDLLDANKNIIISSPAISGQKVYELINMLKEKQASGVQITIVTWTPDSYGFGDAAYWMQLHEDMRKAGFYIKTVEESCERFAVIDQEVVWYGIINLLAKTKVDDSIMRVLSNEIAGELMEIIFENNS